MGSASDNKKRIDKKAKHSGWEYRTVLLCAHMPSNRIGGCFDYKDVDAALNSLSADGWEFQGEITQRWNGGTTQVFTVFRRKLT